MRVDRVISYFMGDVPVPKYRGGDIQSYKKIQLSRNYKNRLVSITRQYAFYLKLQLHSCIKAGKKFWRQQKIWTLLGHIKRFHQVSQHTVTH